MGQRVKVGVDDLLFGARPVWVGSLTHPLLPRITRNRFLDAAVCLGTEAVGVPGVALSGPASVDRRSGQVSLEGGGEIAVSVLEAPVRVRVSVRSAVAGTEPLVTFSSEAGVFEAKGDGFGRVVEFEAFPDQRGTLFRATSRRGTAFLEGWHLEGRPRLSGRVDDGILASIDEPAENAQVVGDLRVRGWCWDKVPIEPVERRLDDIPLRFQAVLRLPRPDVAAALAAREDVLQPATN